MTRCLLAAFCWLASVATAFAATTSAQPNIIFVLVDDLRWDDLGCAGHSFSQTPNIDRVACEGAQFLNAFATTPLCSPSRASILTGEYAHVHGIIDNTERSKQSHQLKTFPQELQKAGYETAFFGKWHMGNDNTSIFPTLCFPECGKWDITPCAMSIGSTFITMIRRTRTSCTT
jgi:arylsulfatase A-like enzyme